MNEPQITGETQYNEFFDNPKYSDMRMGPMRAYDWDVDPRRLAFTFSRYKFVSKMLEGKRLVAEIGCGDALASKLVAQAIPELHLSDFDERFVSIAKKIFNGTDSVSVFRHDILSECLSDKYDAIYALDVLEHIEKTQEMRFMSNICESLSEHGILILGMPSLESQVYASPISKAGHVNCKSGFELKKIVELFFQNVALFSMNDEVIHTGFSKLAHYLFAVGYTPRRID